MSYTRIFADSLPVDEFIDTSLLYKYLTMSVENAEYPTAVPLLAFAVVLTPVIAGIDMLTGSFGMFSQGKHKHSHHSRAFLDIDGVDDKCEGCSYRNW